MSFETRLNERLSEQKKHNLFRQRKILTSAQAGKIHLSGKQDPIVNFCSNDYLGLASHPELIDTLAKASQKYGVGSGASHLVIGHSQAHQLLEEELADFLGVPKCLVFGSGYSANMGVLTTVLGKKDAVLEDKLNHASLLDGGLFSGAKFSRYPHKDLHNLEEKLIATQQKKLVVSDAVFSMDGDSADIRALNTLAKKHAAWLMLDDAHGFGVCGEAGRGSVSAQKEVQSNINIYMATFGKALGTSGAFVAGSETLIESLIQFCRHYIYTTAMPPAIAETTRHALKLMQQENGRREQLNTLIQFFKQEAKIIGLSLGESDTPIQPIILGSAETALHWSNQLLENNILVTAIRPPTVPQNASRLRVTFSALHEKQDVEKLLEALTHLQKQDVLGEGQ